MPAESQPRHFHLSGIRIDALRFPDMLAILREAIATRQKTLLLGHNLHSLYLHQTLPDWREFYKKADWVYVDGMTVISLGRLAGLPLHSKHRITLLDRFEDVIRESEASGWRVFYLGGTAEVQRTGLAVLRARHPTLQLSGRNGYFPDTQPMSRQVIDEINQFKPDVLFVGMGMPRQERWLAKYYSQLDAPVVLTCGATLSYTSGHSYRPPAWASSWGLYGVMRLIAEPRRLWKRYLIEPFILIGTLLPGIFRQRFRRSSVSLPQ